MRRAKSDAAVVYFLGNDLKQLKTAASDFGKKHKFTHVPLLVSDGSKYGPKRMKLHADAQVTVIIYQMKPGKVVKANHAYGKGSLNLKAVTTVIADIEKHLK